MIGVYAIINTLSGDAYVGCTKNIGTRFNNHRSMLKYNRHTNPRLQFDWNLFGSEVFDFLVLEELSEVSTEREQFYIDKMGSYNLTGAVETPFLGKRHTEENRVKSGNALRGKTLSPEHKAKIRAALMGNRNGVRTRYTSAVMGHKPYS